MTPTRDYSALIFYDKPRLGGRANYFTHKIFEQIMWMAGKAPVKQFWQLAWGRRVHELGAGAKPVPRKELTAERLADAIQIALFPAVRVAAKDLGTKIQSERGAENAARIIDRCCARKRARSS